MKCLSFYKMTKKNTNWNKSENKPSFEFRLLFWNVLLGPSCVMCLSKRWQTANRSVSYWTIVSSLCIETNTWCVCVCVCLSVWMKAGADQSSRSGRGQGCSWGSGGGAGEEDAGGREGGVHGEHDRRHRQGENEDGGREAHGATLCKQSVKSSVIMC